MTDQKFGTRQEWAAARAQLLTREKEFSKMGDELARQRRELPGVRVEKSYRFVAEDGVKTLGDLFDGRSQLLIYHFMYGPDYDGGCPTCSSTADSFDGVLAHLKANDMTVICVSRAPIEQLLAYRRRMGWHFNWVSSSESDFNFDYGVSAEAEATHELASPLSLSGKGCLTLTSRWAPSHALDLPPFFEASSSGPTRNVGP